ncbi:MAG: hypothetical protein ACI81L_000663 [Verrucomicrobiales bacterium]|jgi:hypothetical protein
MTKTINSAETSNDLIDLTNDRIDNLAALITVTAEQMDERNAAGEAIESGAHRTAELVELVFGSNTPSVESYLAAHGTALVAA